MGLRPPVTTSWKPGQSGNPKGKIKGMKDKRQWFNEELMLAYHESGQAANIMAVIEKHALQGNMKALSLFCDYVLFKSHAPLTEEERQERQNNIDQMLTLEQIKAIAEIMQNKKNESE